MDAAEVLTTVLRDAGLTKSVLSARSGVSRALIDDYLAGRKQPSFAQVDRLVVAAGRRAEVAVHGPPTPAPSALVDVLELGELFDPRPPDPLPDLGAVWRARRV